MIIIGQVSEERETERQRQREEYGIRNTEILFNKALAPFEDIDTDREKQRQRETERDTHTETETDRQTVTERERDRDRETKTETANIGQHLVGMTSDVLSSLISREGTSNFFQRHLVLTC